MKQYRYIINKNLSYDDMLQQIKDLPEYRAGQRALLQLVEPECVRNVIKKDLDLIKGVIPNVSVIGMTSHGALSRTTTSIKYPICSLLFFEKSFFKVHVYDCHIQTPGEAGAAFHKELEELESVKGVIMMSSDVRLGPEAFIDEINVYDHKLPVFGALAGTKNMGNDKSLIYVNDKIYDRAILAVALYGEDLHITPTYNLGFVSLGKELTITKSDDGGVVYEINNRPAFNIYRDHLGIQMNDYFFENTSSFPFMLKQNGYDVARVALGYGEDGSLAFATEIPVGTSVSLGYATNDYLLNTSKKSAERLFHHGPEAILIYACMSRRMLMGDELAELEFDFFEHVLPTATWAHGYGEILHIEGLRGFLNASLVAVGMREGELLPKYDRNLYKPLEVDESQFDMCQDGYVPLAERLVNFLESTTKDLRDAVDQLFKIASIDELTQIYNRRALNHFMEQYIDHLRILRDVAVIMVDIDHFKDVNDNFGHDVGDIILRDGVDQMKAYISQKDIMGRWGGEEFIMISPRVTKEKTLQTAERIRAAVENHHFESVGHVTISCGVTMLHEGDTVDEVYKRVDEALYEAKETGRNKVIFH